MCVAISGVSGTPSARITSNTISPHAAGRLVEPVERAVHPVAGVVIDVDDEAPFEAVDAGAGEVAAFHHDDGIDGAVRRDLARHLDAVHAGEVEVVLGRRVGVDDPDLLAERVEREGQRQLRSDRIAVRPCVRGQQEALPAYMRGSSRICGATVAGGGRGRLPSAGQSVCASASCRVARVAAGVAARVGADLLEDSFDPVAALDRLRRRRTRARARASGAAAGRCGGAGTASRARARAAVPGAPSRRRASCSRRARPAGPGVTLTCVIVRKPMPGSCTSRARRSVSSARS